MPLESNEDEDFNKALEEVIGSIMERADAERAKEKPYQDMWAASEQGLKSLIDEAHNQCSHVIIGLCDVIKKKFNIRMTNKLYDLLKALPFAWKKVEKTIIDKEGHSCCIDKTRFLYYQEVLAEIKRIQEEK